MCFISLARQYPRMRVQSNKAERDSASYLQVLLEDCNFVASVDWAPCTYQELPASLHSSHKLLPCVPPSHLPPFQRLPASSPTTSFTPGALCTPASPLPYQGPQFFPHLGLCVLPIPPSPWQRLCRCPPPSLSHTRGCSSPYYASLNLPPHTRDSVPPSPSYQGPLFCSCQGFCVLPPILHRPYTLISLLGWLDPKGHLNKSVYLIHKNTSKSILQIVNPGLKNQKLLWKIVREYTFCSTHLKQQFLQTDVVFVLYTGTPTHL